MGHIWTPGLGFGDLHVFHLSLFSYGRISEKEIDATLVMRHHDGFRSWNANRAPGFGRRELVLVALVKVALVVVALVVVVVCVCLVGVPCNLCRS